MSTGSTTNRAVILREYGMAIMSSTSANAVAGTVNIDAIDATEKTDANVASEGDKQLQKVGPPSGGRRHRPGIETDALCQCQDLAKQHRQVWTTRHRLETASTTTNGADSTS